jgi:hypothetical protein
MKMTSSSTTYMLRIRLTEEVLKDLGVVKNE